MSHCTLTIGVAATRREIEDVDRMTRRIDTQQEIKTETETENTHAEMYNLTKLDIRIAP